MNDMIKIKLAERTGNGCSLFLPCALPELIQGSVPYFISYGEAEITFKTGNNQLDAVLKEQLVNTGTIRQGLRHADPHVGKAERGRQRRFVAKALRWGGRTAF